LKNILTIVAISRRKDYRRSCCSRKK